MAPIRPASTTPSSLCPSSRWTVRVDDVQNVVQTAVGGKAVSQIVEGERKFDLTLRWPERLRRTETQVLDIPVDVANTITPGSVPGLGATPFTGSGVGVSPT